MLYRGSAQREPNERNLTMINKQKAPEKADPKKTAEKTPKKEELSAEELAKISGGVYVKPLN